ncbi:MAG: alpha-amylase family glycosyl hydrolase [Chloroherpetonaceae bacterium]|nr:alpha-amylase family glycosyl hydrolase [Chloroherpetonaceae bacterium]MDW8436963.1 alpha-amylase family glycosyl hydrolase [Chloroherpetonaceae bacterium]
MSDIRFPLVYEINARVWLRELSKKHGKPITLASVPETEFQRWKQHRFDAIWLMGVWKPSPKGREIALHHRGLWQEYSRALPDWTADDVACSPYCIAEYATAEELGGESGLQKFRERLHANGMKLILDFVPNHVALDHPWLSLRPDYFIAAPKSLALQSEDFYSPDGERFFACGKDPYFPAWTDTLQLNYANPSLRKAMIQTLRTVAEKCDGVRCDMAMLELKSVFNRTWGWLAGEMTEEFWIEAISQIKTFRSDFLFIAEAYWDTEWTLQQMGFDFTYDKKLYDRLHRRDIFGVKGHLSANWDYQRKMVCFSENHDEERAVARFGENARAVMLLVLTMPGMRLVHQGQIEGYSRRLPVQLLRRYDEAGDERIAQFYQRLSHALQNPAITCGNFQLLNARGDQDVIAFARRCGDRIAQTFTLVNLSDFPKEIRFETDAFDDVESYEHVEVITTEPRHSPQFDLWNGGISVRLRAREGLLFVAKR